MVEDSKIFTNIKKILLSILISIAFIMLLTNKAEATLTVDQLRVKFPNGAYWNGGNPDKYTLNPCPGYQDGYTWYHTSHNQCNWFDSGEECKGFARKLYYDFYGKYAYGQTTHSNLNNIKVGDILEYKGRGTDSNYTHAVWVLGVDDNNIYVVECNWSGNCIIRWDRQIPRTDIWSDITIYPGVGDTESPVIHDMYVDMDSITSTSYKVVARVTDNVNVYSGGYNLWAGSNPYVWVWAAKSGEYWNYTVKKSNFNNASGLYTLHGYFKDDAENQASKALAPFPMGTTVEKNLGNFVARMVLKSNEKLAVGIDGTGNVANVSLKTKNAEEASQVWKFTKHSDNTYTIMNITANRALDNYNASNKNNNSLKIVTSNNSDAQRYYIMNYNGGYRIVPKSSPDVKSLNVAGTIAAGADIQLYEATSLTNNAQTFKFEKVATTISISSSKLNLETGSTKQLTATTDISGTKLFWSSSNESIATVDENGNVVGKGAGKVTITVSPYDRRDITATCEVEVEDSNATSFSLDKVRYQIDFSTENPQIKAVTNTGSNAAVTWSSNNTKVAKVDQNGVITPVSGGFAYISAKSEKFGTKKCWLYVCELVELSDGSKLYPGDLDGNGMINANDAAMIIDAYRYSSTFYKLVADMDGNGKIDSEDKDLNLSVYTYNCFRPGKYKPYDSITLNKSSVSIGVGESTTLKATMTATDLTGITDAPTPSWRSSDIKTAIVDSNGKVTGLKPGTVTITARTTYGKTATCEVTVGSGSAITTLSIRELKFDDVIPLMSGNVIGEFTNTTNFPILADGTAKVQVLDENGQVKDDASKVGSRNRIQVLDNSGKNIMLDLPVVVPGDVDGDGRARMLDAFDMLRDVIRNKEFEDIEFEIRDYNGDGKIRMLDAFDFCRDAIRKK